MGICFCNVLLYYFSCVTAIRTEKNSLANTRMKALEIVCGKPDENLQPPQAGHTDLHVYIIRKVYRAQASKFASPGCILRKAFYISCAVSEKKFCVLKSKENNYDSGHISSS